SAAIILGAVSQHYDETFANIILGDGYVNATEDRIAEGDPMGIYGESSETSMLFRITINNIQVSFYAFVLGIFFSFGSYIILLSNGIMLGAFQWWFYGKGILLTSFLAIWIHGAFEISAIVIAAAAGITLGNGLLFPKSHSRLQSLIFSAKQGFIILMSLVPVFIIAGTLESFVTRYYQSMPIFLNYLIIFGSFAAVIIYYGIIPFRIARLKPDKAALKEMPRHIPQRDIKPEKIRTTGEIFSDAVYSFIIHIKTYSTLTFKLILPIAFTLLAVVAYFQTIDLRYENDWNINLDIVFGATGQFRVYKFFGWTFILSITISIALYAVQNTAKFNMQEYLKASYRSILWLLLFASLIMIGYVFLPWFPFILLILFAGFFIQFVPIIIVHEKVNLFIAIQRSFALIKLGYGQAIANSLAMTAITIVFFFILNNPMGLGILMLIDRFIADVLVGNTTHAYLIINLFNIAAYIVFIAFAVQLFYVNGYYFYHSQLEKGAAKDLKEKINTVGKRSKVFETAIDFE
ncbi:MAG: stage II sporulation protein M, partial [Crocinitomicaceae bacterium]